ncbi:glutaredoxin [Oxobacter pfennigii]|uniref:Glutaredoxin n=1 Tax=Oxobacter pfennigii TaxID=36849 RepID=A0A0N8NTP8_9CLOT|nr:thioredoxin family protein [Oxobacter pfennigii]KPU45432.1 glutaredoxin [Oxobacter pfennigii]
MKPVLMFTLNACPYCQRALSMVEELKENNPEYRKIQITIIDEGRQPEIADKYDYFYVPTYYVDGVKVHEGAATLDMIKKVLDTAME